MKITIILAVLIDTTLGAFCQVEDTAILFKTLKSRDSLLFEVGYNTCDVSQFELLLSDDFEFYHDKSGITGSKTAFVTSIKEGLCKMDYQPRRELVENSLEVYPLENNGILYGAIQIGEHRFYAVENDGAERMTSVARFTHLWLLMDGQWKLARGLSFDHKATE